ncbi:rod shape-determining protein MreC [Paracidobacterium acidisoli]|uniref:Cell shape-determining protein MreC n=1 Tax=Paracidobacterium acidisoli TaxID=2303751 RepID=A0A372IPN4_9BACT|nr:rod shape-determining protein MreC [Paracidobacterium acidisoli]MBT9331191.1 rod shape-determining protein MreC [Paracidobacterium acidisoli]
MESFLSRYKNALVLVTVLLVQVLGLAVQVRRPASEGPEGKGVRLIRYWVMSLIAPPEHLLHMTGGGIRGLWSNYVDLIHVRRTNAKLQEQIDHLRIEEASLAEDARQGQRLQGMLGFRERYIYQTVPAQVIGVSGTEDSHVLIIDKGSKDGLKIDMPVITPDGIVGKTREVLAHSSQVLEISDATSGAGVILETTRIRGVLRGSSWGQPQIVNVSPDDRIKAGEKVITSGGDAIFPRGLPVGTVDRTVPDPDGTLMDILIHPAANLSRLEEVLVVTSMGDLVPGQTQIDIAESEAQKASDILAERLPSRADPNAPQVQGDDLADATAEGDVARPIRPPATLHPDVFTPGSTPSAADMTPGARLGHVLSGEGQPVPVRKTTPAAPASASSAVPAAVKKSAPAMPGAVSAAPQPVRPAEKAPQLVHDYSGATPPQYSHPAVRTPSTVAGPGTSRQATPHPPGQTASHLNPAAPRSATSAPAAGEHALPRTTVIVDGPDRSTQKRKPAPPAHAAPSAPPRPAGAGPQGRN